MYKIYLVYNGSDEGGEPSNPILCFTDENNAIAYVEQRKENRNNYGYGYKELPVLEKLPKSRKIYVKNMSIELANPSNRNRWDKENKKSYWGSIRHGEEIFVIYDCGWDNLKMRTGEEKDIILKVEETQSYLEDINEGLPDLSQAKKRENIIININDYRKQNWTSGCIYFVAYGFDREEVELEAAKFVEKYKNLTPKDF